MSTGCTIRVSGVHKSFEDGRVRALRDVSFSVDSGELVALTGASGSGKSTLLNLLGALDTPDAGSIEIDGRPLGGLGSSSRYRTETVGFDFQSHNLLPTLTAGENVQVPMFGRRPRRERAARAAELLREVGLEDRLAARPGVLSGGERNASRSRARSQTSRGSCSPTSRPARSTRSRARTSSTSSIDSAEHAV